MESIHTVVRVSRVQAGYIFLMTVFLLQMWDLRFATSPMKVLEGHQR